MITLEQFTEHGRIGIKHDACWDRNVPGKFGHLYQHGSGEFGLVLEAPADSPRFDRTLRNRKGKALAAGFTLHQEGDAEAILLFDPTDASQARLAIRLVGARLKRIPSAAQLEALRKAQDARQIAQNQRAEAVIQA